VTDPHRPLIAVNGLLETGERPALRLVNGYAESVLRAGGVPLAIPPVGGPADVRRLLAAVDGLLLTGGDDFDMERLGLGPTHPRASPTPGPKQDFDVELVRAALEAGLPVLGICYGMQLMALVEGGRLHQHLPDDRPACQQHSGNVTHAVAVEAGTKLAGVLGVEHLDVVSRHHQAVAEVAPPWRVCARDAEGLIEAVERQGQPLALGVQWHPELAPEGSPHDRLFRALVHAAAARAQRRAPRAPAPSPVPR
jgi:gamma-glutamyl-gamma-aminobutyrate hydrolase PuuD